MAIKYPPPVVAAAFMFFGVLLLFLSFPAGIAFVSRDGKEVGYVYAVNWSIGLTVLAPLLLFFVYSATREVRHLFRALEHKGMLVNTTNQPWSFGHAAALQDEWSCLSRKALRIWLLLTFLALVWSLTEFWLNSAWPLIQGKVALMGEPNQADWDVGAVLKERSGFWTCANLSFCLVAYLVGQTVIASAVLGLVVLVFTISVLIHKRTTPGPGIRILPSLSSGDSRMGFEVFEPFLLSVLYALSVCFLLLYCTRVQNIYLRSKAPSIGAFVQEDIILGFVGSLKAREPAYLLSFGSGDFSSVVAIVAPVICIACVGVFLVLLLRNGARRSRDTLRDYAKNYLGNAAVCCGMTADEVTRRLNEMEVWPFRYPKPNELMLIFGASAATLIWYRIGLVVFGVLLFTVVSRMVSMAKGTCSSVAVGKSDKSASGGLSHQEDAE